MKPRERQYRTGATCAICGIAAGNSLGILVHRYQLQRSTHGPDGPRGIRVGSMALCTDCIRRYGRPRRARPTAA